MTSWARRLAGLDLLSKKSRGNAAAAAPSKGTGARSAHSGRHFLAEKYAGDDSIVMSGSCGAVRRADDEDEDDVLNTYEFAFIYNEYCNYEKSIYDL